MLLGRLDWVVVMFFVSLEETQGDFASKSLGAITEVDCHHTTPAPRESNTAEWRSTRV